MGTNERKRRTFTKQILALVVILIVGFLGFKAIESERAAGASVEIAFRLPEGKRTAVFNLEVAADAPSRAKGLMFRKSESIPDDGGMIFIFPEDQRLSFWMRNTVAPLDMIFLDSALTVQGVLHDVPIMNETPRTLDKIGRYVVELKAGTAARHGITAGAVLEPVRPLPRGR